MGAFDEVENVDDLFKQLDDGNYSNIAKPLGSLRRELMKEGFTRREAVRLVESYSRFIYDITLEDFLSEKGEEEMDSDELTSEDDPDDFAP